MLRLVESKNSVRRDYLNKMLEVAEPILVPGSKRELKKAMDVQKNQMGTRGEVSWFEGVGRTICGISAWLTAEPENEEERALQEKVAELTRQTIAGQVDPESPDNPGFVDMISGQLLVDIAFMAQGMMRAKEQLIDKLPEKVKQDVIKVFQDSRRITPGESNWLLFSAEVEACLHVMGQWADKMRVNLAVKTILSWYKGDSMYGDGRMYAQDYYNSYVIQPMLIDCAEVFQTMFREDLRNTIVERSKRYAKILERMIAPDGSFIVVGRSITYRCGAFHLLSQMAWQKRLPEDLSEAQVREAILAVTERTLGKESFREDGYLNIGMCCDQPSLGDDYISTGSLYLCTFSFLILGLSASDSFWTAPYQDWTQKAIWSGKDVMRDHKISF